MSDPLLTQARHQSTVELAQGEWMGSNTATVRRPRTSNPVATLWRLAWNDDRLSCAVYRRRDKLEMRLETGGRTILTEPFEIRPRMLARMQALRRSLKRRGWQDFAG